MLFKLGKCLNSIRNISLFKCCINPCSCCSTAPNLSSKQKPSFFNQIRLIYYTFFYNQNNDSLTAVETLLHPIVECVSSILRYLGWILVLFVIVLIANMIIVFYTIIVPQMFKTAPFIIFLIHFTLGNILAVNTVFHYAMGLFTSPGYPPTTKVENIVTICKKCILPKPARTHHCSICKKCVLKMDHHCPWFNNCIGFYNHRYFFLFCIFIDIDCLYLSSFGFYYFQARVYPGMNLNVFTFIMATPSSNLYYQLTSIEFFVAFVAMIALLILIAINAFIISYGATNIELRSMRIPCIKSTYYVHYETTYSFCIPRNPKNPYDLGFKNNWKVFLGFDDFRSFIMKVVLPSNHKPMGDGVDWSDYFNYKKISPDYQILQV